MRTHLLGSICTTGGSISRLQDAIYREAADLAYYFHWQRGDILGMTGQERRIWLSQLQRIHYEQRQARDREVAEQAAYYSNLRDKETE